MYLKNKAGSHVYFEQNPAHEKLYVDRCEIALCSKVRLFQEYLCFLIRVNRREIKQFSFEHAKPQTKVVRSRQTQRT